jgi:hypothetical protein
LHSDPKPTTATQISRFLPGSTPDEPDLTELCWTLMLRERDQRAAAGENFMPLAVRQNAAPVTAQAPSKTFGPSTDLVEAMRLGAQLLRELGKEGTELGPAGFPLVDEARTRAGIQCHADDDESPRGNGR